MIGHDVAVFMGANGGDVKIGETDLVGEEGLNTAVYLSLFTDARNEAERGWCLEDRLDPWGSRLWTLQRSSITDDTLRQAKQYTREALAWMIEDEITDLITVDSEFGLGSILGISITIRNSGVRRWSSLWDSVSEQVPVTFGGAILVALEFDGQAGELNFGL